MQPRQTLIDQFSTFLKFAGDRPIGWGSDIRLQRNMETCMAALDAQQGSEYFWSLYWHRQWLSMAASTQQDTESRVEHDALDQPLPQLHLGDLQKRISPFFERGRG